MQLVGILHNRFVTVLFGVPGSGLLLCGDIRVGVVPAAGVMLDETDDQRVDVLW